MIWTWENVLIKRVKTVVDAASRICGKTTVFAEILISPLPQCLWPPNVAGWWLTIRDSYRLSHMILWSHGLPRSLDKLKAIISPLTLPTTIKLGRIGTYVEECLAMKSHDLLVMLSYKMTWQNEIILSPLPQCLGPPN